MSSLRLNDRMPNGASVSDWLGTAMTAARIAGGIIEDVREQRPGAPIVRGKTDEEKLQLALAQAEQAAAELGHVLAHYGVHPGSRFTAMG